MANEITIPYNFTPRHYQLPVFQSVFDQSSAKKKKHIVMMSRRLGKTLSLLHILSTAMTRRVGNYLMLLPYATQARSVVWTGKTNDDISIIDAVFPRQLVESINHSSMTIKLINGSMLRISGADNVDALVGNNFIGIVFDEAARIKADVLGYLLPIVEAHEDGWIIFSSTPIFGSWFTKMYFDESRAENSIYSIHTCNIYESGIFTEERIAQIKQDYINRYGPDDGNALFNTEYALDIQGSNAGSFYGAILQSNIDNIRSVEPVGEVYASWDLGHNDSNVISVFNKIGKQLVLIDVISGSGRTVQDYYRSDVSKLPYKIKCHYLPHDGAQVRGYTTKTTARDALLQLGAVVKIIPKSNSVLDDINAVREQLPNIIFNNKPSVSFMRDKLKAYSKKLRDGVVVGHDHCDFADSFRYMVLSSRMIRNQVETNSNEYEDSSAWA